MQDKFKQNFPQPNSPASTFESITPSDTDLLQEATRAIYVGSAGNMVAVSVNDNEVTFNNLVAGTIYPFRIKQVKSTGTTASGLVGLS